MRNFTNTSHGSQHKPPVPGRVLPRLSPAEQVRVELAKHAHRIDPREAARRPLPSLCLLDADEYSSDEEAVTESLRTSLCGGQDGMTHQEADRFIAALYASADAEVRAECRARRS